jgi:serine/threonine-protein phosphatase 4 catalytic subunit
MSEHSDLDRQIEQLKRCEIIKENEVKVLCAKAREILIEESNVQRIDSPVVVSSSFFFFFCLCAKRLCCAS